MLCCTSCISTKHQNCSYVNQIVKEAASQREVISVIEHEIQDVCIEAHKVEKLLEKADDTFGQTDSINQLIETIKKTLIKQCDDLKAMINEHFKAAERCLTDDKMGSIATIRSISDDLDTKSKLLESVKKCGTSEQKFIATRVVESLLTSYHSKLEEKRIFSFKPFFHIETSESLKKILERKRVSGNVLCRQNTGRSVNTR